MTSLSFDIRGNLPTIPFIELSVSEVEQIFVKPVDKVSKRHILFEEYKRYTLDLQNLIDCPFYQWIDGSFVSNRFNPNDIDLVSFIDYDIYQEKERLIDDRFSKWSVGQHYSGLDAFTVWSYPATHKHSALFQADCAYWNDWFGHTRYNRNRKRFLKGFVQVTID